MYVWVLTLATLTASIAFGLLLIRHNRYQLRTACTRLTDKTHALQRILNLETPTQSRSLETIIQDILQRTNDIVTCEEAFFFLLDPTFDCIYKISRNSTAPVTVPYSYQNLPSPLHKLVTKLSQIPQGEALEIEDVFSDPEFRDDAIDLREQLGCPCVSLAAIPTSSQSPTNQRNVQINTHVTQHHGFFLFVNRLRTRQLCLADTLRFTAATFVQRFFHLLPSVTQQAGVMEVLCRLYDLLLPLNSEVTQPHSVVESGPLAHVIYTPGERRRQERVSRIQHFLSTNSFADWIRNEQAKLPKRVDSFDLEDVSLLRSLARTYSSLVERGITEQRLAMHQLSSASLLQLLLNDTATAQLAVTDRAKIRAYMQGVARNTAKVAGVSYVVIYGYNVVKDEFRCLSSPYKSRIGLVAPVTDSALGFVLRSRCPLHVHLDQNLNPVAIFTTASPAGTKWIPLTHELIHEHLTSNIRRGSTSKLYSTPITSDDYANDSADTSTFDINSLLQPSHDLWACVPPSIAEMRGKARSRHLRHRRREAHRRQAHDDNSEPDLHIGAQSFSPPVATAPLPTVVSCHSSPVSSLSSLTTQSKSPIIQSPSLSSTRKAIFDVFQSDSTSTTSGDRILHPYHHVNAVVSQIGTVGDNTPSRTSSRARSRSPSRPDLFRLRSRSPSRLQPEYALHSVQPEDFSSPGSAVYTMMVTPLQLSDKDPPLGVLQAINKLTYSSTSANFAYPTLLEKYGPHKVATHNLGLKLAEEQLFGDSALHEASETTETELSFGSEISESESVGAETYQSSEWCEDSPAASTSRYLKTFSFNDSKCFGDMKPAGTGISITQRKALSAEPAHRRLVHPCASPRPNLDLPSESNVNYDANPATLRSRNSAYGTTSDQEKPSSPSSVGRKILVTNIHIGTPQLIDPLTNLSPTDASPVSPQKNNQRFIWPTPASHSSSTPLSSLDLSSNSNGLSSTAAALVINLEVTGHGPTEPNEYLPRMAAINIASFDDKDLELFRSLSAHVAVAMRRNQTLLDFSFTTTSALAHHEAYSIGWGISSANQFSDERKSQQSLSPLGEATECSPNSSERLTISNHVSLQPPSANTPPFGRYSLNAVEKTSSMSVVRATQSTIRAAAQNLNALASSDLGPSTESDDSDPETDEEQYGIARQPIVSQINIEILQGNDFSVFDWNHGDLVYAMYLMVDDLHLIDELGLSRARLEQFIHVIANGYHLLPYHNWYHGVCVGWFVYRTLKFTQLQNCLTRLEALALLTAGFTHDVGHPGQNNDYLIATQSELALLYNDRSVLENLHANVTMTMLNNPATNFIEEMPLPNRRAFRKALLTTILATDMTHHFSLCRKLDELTVHALDSFKTTHDANRTLLLELVIHSGDLCGPVLPMRSSLEWERRISREFIDQANLEASSGLITAPSMRNLENFKTRASNQISFIDVILTPLWRHFVTLFPEFNVYLEQLKLYRKFYVDASNGVVELPGPFESC